MRYNDVDGFEGDVFEADTGSLEGRYKGVLGASTAQQVIRKNSEAWRAFFRLKEQHNDESNTSSRTTPNRRASVEMRTTGDKPKPSFATHRTLSMGRAVPTRDTCRQKAERQIQPHRAAPAGNRWRPELARLRDTGRLDLWYDETDSTFRASQPVTISADAWATPLADETDALDIGANNLVACTTTTGEQYLYDGRGLF